MTKKKTETAANKLDLLRLVREMPSPWRYVDMHDSVKKAKAVTEQTAGAQRHFFATNAEYRKINKANSVAGANLSRAKKRIEEQYSKDLQHARIQIMLRGATPQNVDLVERLIQKYPIGV